MASFGDVAERFAKMRERAENPEPGYRVVGAYLVAETIKDFSQQREFSGDAFVPLATATIDARLRKAGAKKVAKRGAAKGYLTASSAKKQARMLAPGGMKILIDTARARNSVHTTADAHGLVFSVVGYLASHMAGTADIPRRNPTPFNRTGNGWALDPVAAKRVREIMTEYIATGAVKS